MTTTDTAMTVARRRKIIEVAAMVGTWLFCTAATLLGTYKAAPGADIPFYNVAAAWISLGLRLPWFWLHALLAWILGWGAATIVMLLFLGVLWAAVVSAVLSLVFALSDRRAKSRRMTPVDSVR